MGSEDLFDMFPADLNLWTPKFESLSPILESRIEVQASIQERAFGTSSGHLSSMCWGFFFVSFCAGPFWGVLPQYGNQIPVPLYFSLEARLCSLTWRHKVFQWSQTIAAQVWLSCLDAGFWLAWMFYTQVPAIRKS